MDKTMASRRLFQFAPVIILQMRTLNYATSLAVVRHAWIAFGFLVFNGTAPHRRFRTAVIAHRSKPGRLLRYQLRPAFIAGAAGMPVSLVGRCGSIATDSHCKYHGNQRGGCNPCTTSRQVGHIA